MPVATGSAAPQALSRLFRLSRPSPALVPLEEGKEKEKSSFWSLIRTPHARPGALQTLPHELHWPPVNRALLF